MEVGTRLRVRLLGDMDVLRDGTPLALPRSKKTRALLAYLAVTGRAHRRDSLCSMFWDIPDDPRGSLRWSLSKLRPVVDEPGTRRVSADRESVRFVPADAEVDILELRRAVVRGLASLNPQDLSGLAEDFRGDFLEGLDLPNCPDFQAWLVAQRDEARRLRAQVLRALIPSLGHDPEAGLFHARTLVQLNRHDAAAWVELVSRLVAAGCRLEAEQQFEAGREALAALGPGEDAALERAWRQSKDPNTVAATTGPARAPDPIVGPDAAASGRAEATAQEPAASAPATLALPDAPSIAVLPFENLGDDPADRHLSEGIAADLIERLGHNRRLFVISRGTALALGETPFDLAAVRDGVGVRHVLTGDLRRDGSDVSVTARLSDATLDRTLWAQDFKGPLNGVFALERDLAETVVRTIDPGADKVPDLTFGLPHPTAEAWAIYQRGSLHLYKRTASDLARALELFEEATDLDPDFARARAASIDAMYYQVALDYLTPAPDWREDAMRRARRAVETAPRDAAVHCALGQAHLIMREPQAAVPAFEDAVALNPSFAWAHYGIGAAKVLSGNARDAVPHLERAIRISPRDRNMGSFLLRTADAYLFMRRYEDAVDWARRALREPLFQWSRYAVLLSALGHLGRHDEAREVLDELLSQRPDFSIELVRSTHLYTDKLELEYVAEPQLFVDQDEFAHYLDGLRKAGVPAR